MYDESSTFEAPRQDTCLDFELQQLQSKQNQLLKWLKQHDYNHRKDNNLCVPGIGKLIKNIETAKSDVEGHLFHACLLRCFYETGEFDIQVEKHMRPKDNPVDLVLYRKTDAETDMLLIEAWYGKSSFARDMVKLSGKKSGAIATRWDEDARTIAHKLSQLPPGKGFVVNYATGTEELGTLPIPPVCPDDKCVVTLRRDRQAYIYGSSNFQYLDDACYICKILGWNPNNMLGMTDSTAKMYAKDTVQVGDAAHASKNYVRFL